MIVKPLDGHGGAGVFLVAARTATSADSESVTQFDQPIMAQRYIRKSATATSA